jgi:hypothetical protein
MAMDWTDIERAEREASIAREFQNGRDDENIDANDLERQFGLDAVRRAFDARQPGHSTHLRPGFNPLTGDTIDGPREVGILPLADLDAWATSQASPKPFVLAGRIPKHEITLLTGDGGTNKSTFGQQLATCRAAGKRLLGMDLEPGVTLYETAEDDFDRLPVSVICAGRYSRRSSGLRHQSLPALHASPPLSGRDWRRCSGTNRQRFGPLGHHAASSSASSVVPKKWANGAFLPGAAIERI